MSIEVVWNKLTVAQQSLIKNYLVITPKESFFDMKRKKWKKKYKNDDDDDDDDEESNKSVTFYSYNHLTDIIKLPYKFAEKLLLSDGSSTPDLSKIVNKQLIHIPFTFNVPLLDNQVDLYTDAWNYLIKNRTLNFCPYTGSGKTAMAIKMCAELTQYGNMGIPLAMMTITDLLPQWDSSIKMFTNAIPYIVNSPNFKPPQGCNFLISTPGMTKYIPEEWRSQIGILILDEAHKLCSISRSEALLFTQPKYIIACTATFERDDGMHTMIEVITGVDRIELISKKPYLIYKLNTGCNMELPKNRFGDTDWNALVNMLCGNEYRNNLILELVKSNIKEHKILVMTLRQAHVKLLYQKTVEMGIDSDYMTGNKKKYHDSNVLYGSIQKLGTGFDEKTKCADFNNIRISLLILCISIKALAALKQVLGRVIRANFPNMIYLVDNTKSESHFNGTIKWFKESNGTIIEQNTHKHLENLKNDPISSGGTGDVAHKQMMALLNSTRRI